MPRKTRNKSESGQEPGGRPGLDWPHGCRWSDIQTLWAHFLDYKPLDLWLYVTETLEKNLRTANYRVKRWTQFQRKASCHSRQQLPPFRATEQDLDWAYIIFFFHLISLTSSDRIFLLSF